MIGNIRPVASHGALKHEVPSTCASRSFARPQFAGRLEIDLLARAFADIADEQVAGRAVEAEPPRIAAIRTPDFGQLPACPTNGFPGGHRNLAPR